MHEVHELIAALNGMAARRVATLNVSERTELAEELEDFSGAMADAAEVPPGFIQHATRDEAAEGRYHGFCNYLTCADFGRHASIAPDYRDVRWEGVPDPRVAVTTTNDVSFDNATTHATTHWFPADKFRTRSDPLQIASYAEAQLVLAEAAARTGDLATARTIINEWAVPYKGEPGSIHPDGVDHTGVPYSPTTCFPLPDVERVGKPNL